MKIVLVLTKVWLLKHVSNRTGGKANSPTPPPGWNQSAASNIIILQAASLLLPIREQATNEKWLTKRGKDIVVFGVQWGVGDRVLWLVGGHLWSRWIRAKQGDSLLCCHGNNMKKRDLLFLVFVCAKFRRGFFLLQLNEEKKNLIWRREPLPSHWKLKNQVKSFKFERYFLDLMNFYSSNFSEDWIRIRIHLKTKMSIAEIKRGFLEVHLWLVERTCGRELWLMENYVRSSRWLLIRASSGWRRQKEYESKIPDLIFTHAVFPPGYHGDPCWFVVRGDSLCWLNQEQPLQEVQHVYFRPAAGQPLTRKTGRSWWPRIT